MSSNSSLERGSKMECIPIIFNMFLLNFRASKSLEFLTLSEFASRPSQSSLWLPVFPPVHLICGLCRKPQFHKPLA